MNNDYIECDKCGNKIELSSAITKEIQKKEKEKYVLEVEKFKKQLEEQSLKQKQELEMKMSENEKKWLKEKAILDQGKAAALELARKEAEAATRSEIEKQIQSLRSDLKTKAEELQRTKDNELALRKRQEEIENLEKNLELEVHRKVDEERKRIREDLLKTVEEKHRLKEAEKDELIESMRNQVKELERKANQGSQQLQGEVLEIDLENKLKAEFVFDEIEAVGKGIRGGDILQTIKTQSGKVCGKILWETKRTKNWSDGWITKLKDDQRECDANLAVLVSETLPQGFHHFREKKGVWVTDIPSALSLAIALRVILIQVSRSREIQVGKEEKMERVYNYLLGNQFKNRVEAIVEAFSQLKSDLDAEKRAMTRIWAKREKQIERVILNTAGLYGDLEGEGLSSQTLPEIKNLELDDTKVNNLFEEL